MTSRACTACGHGNAGAAKFCIECGAATTTACVHCATPTAPGQKFCAECGHDLRAASAEASAATVPPTPEGERKQVTVLFADVAGSMDLAERLGPDELTQVMTGLVQVCREALERFGGTLDKFTGDGVMALFGAPVAQEDHARRACHAALALLDGARTYALTLRQRDIELGVRVGLNSGEVVAGSVAEAFTAVGHTVGLAQRMESLAAPGAAYLSEHTAALVADGFLLRGLGTADVKGSTVPVGIFALEGASGGTAAAGRRRSGSARMVGRDEEFGALQVLLGHAQEGRAQVVGLVGEAGGGKSRLCEELARHATELGVTVRRTSGVSHAQSVPLLPILGLFRDYFAISVDDSPATIREKVAARLLGFDADLDADLGLIFDFLEVPDPDRPAPQVGPDARRRRVLEVFRRATQRRSERETLLLILEDLHWFDPHSTSFLDTWFPSFPGSRTLVVTNFRPEFHAPWAARSYYRQLPLAPLDGTAVEELLGELLGPGAALTEVSQQLLTRAAGNPFFAEEIVRGLAGDGTLTGEAGAYQLTRPASEVRVPPTVQAVLAARIDRLAPREKAVLQSAAVIGRTFTRDVLAAVAGQDREPLDAVLQALCTTELLQQTGTSGEYRFWHTLTQEVAYGTLLATARDRHHDAVARALIDTEPQRHDELAALIATHYESAGNDLEAARWKLRAGGRATNSDFAEARRSLRAAIAHLDRLPDSDDVLTLGVRARTQLVRVGARIGADKAEADQLLADARRAGERLADPAVLAAVSLAAATARIVAGETAGALASYAEACRQAEQADQLGLLAFAHACVGFFSHLGRPLDLALHDIAAALDLCAGDPRVGLDQMGYSVHDFAHTGHAVLLASYGRLGESRQEAQRALAHYERRPMAEWHSWTLSLFAFIADWTGEREAVEEAERAVGDALQLAQDSGSTFLAYPRARQAAGIVELLAGRPDAALARFSDALIEARAAGAGLQEEPGLLAYLARTHLALADVSAARVTSAEAVLVARRQGATVLECQAQLVRARVLRETATGDADLAAAHAAVTAGEALAAETGALTYAAFLAEERARLEPDPAAQRAGLKIAADAYTAIGATGHARRLQTEITT